MDSALADDFKLLSVEARLRILRVLHEVPSLCVKAIATRIELPITPSAVSQHLRLLKAAGWITAQKKGYWVHYSIVPERFRKFKERAADFLRQPRGSKPRCPMREGGRQNARRKSQVPAPRKP